MSLAGLTNWLFTAVVALSFELVQVIDVLRRDFPMGNISPGNIF